MWHLLTIIYLVPFIQAHSPQTAVSIKFPRHLFKMRYNPYPIFPLPPVFNSTSYYYIPLRFEAIW